MVLLWRNNTGKSEAVTQPRISGKSNPSYVLGESEYFQYTDVSSLCWRLVRKRVNFFKGQKGSRKDGVEVWQARSLLGLATAQ